MGMRLFSSGSNSVSPDCTKYEIIKLVQLGKRTAVWVQYHNATNCSGEKILVFKRPLHEMDLSKGLDPHFQWDDPRRLFARFVPTQEGWRTAINLVMEEEK